MKYKELCQAYNRIEQTSRRLEKTNIIAQVLIKGKQEIEDLIPLLSGRLFPAWDKQKLGVSAKLMIKALSIVSGYDNEHIIQELKKYGDLGIVAEKNIENKQQQTLLTQELSVKYVTKQLRKLPNITGTGSVDNKLKIISELLTHASPIEAKYITRTILEELRIGIAEGTIRDAIIYAYLSEEAGIVDGEIINREKYNKISKVIQEAYDKTNDFVVVATKAIQGVHALKEIRIKVGTPIKVMLGEKGTSIREAIKKLGPDVIVQYKYDGFRVEIHKNENDIKIFTRRLEEVSKQFPDIVQQVRQCVKTKKCILDGEAIGIDPVTKNYKPFQEISQRIQRKHKIKELVEKIPCETRIFDIILIDDKELIKEELIKRHEKINSIIEQNDFFKIAHTIITNNTDKAKKFYEQAIKEGVEGVFVKKTTSLYQPGVRAGNWIKIKHTMEPLDLVVIAAEWGEGKRSGWFTSFVLACEGENGELLEIGKAATGLKEKESEGFSFKEITNLLKPLIEYSDGKTAYVKPEIILEVGYEEIQKSNSYSSGYALRFPRILRNRTNDIDRPSSLDYVKKLYKQQLHSEAH